MVKQKEQKEQQQDAENNNTRKAFYVVIFAVTVSIILSLVSWYRTTHGDIAEKNANRIEPGEDLGLFAHRLRAEVVSENVGLVQHSRVGGFALQIQGPTPANTSLVAVPIPSCLSVSNLRREMKARKNTKKSSSKKQENDNSDDNDKNSILSIFKRLDEFKASDFSDPNKNTKWLAQLGINIESKKSETIEKEKEAIWEQLQLVTFLIEARKHCTSPSSTTKSSQQPQPQTVTSSFDHWCPWLRHIVLPNSETFLPLSDFRWRPEVTARCLRQTTRMQYEATLLHVSAMTKMYEAVVAVVNNKNGKEKADKNMDEADATKTRSLVEWALFVLRTRAHQIPSTGESILVPLLDLNDKRVGSHLYRKSSRQAATAAIVLDETGGKVHLVTTEKHSKGAYPLTAPGSWNSVMMSPTGIMQNFGTVPHAIMNSNTNKLFNSNNVKQETENFFLTEHFFSVPVPEGFWEEAAAAAEATTTKQCSSLNNKIYFNISSGVPDRRTSECLKSIIKNNNNNNKAKNPIVELIMLGKQSSSLSSEALFACKSVAAKQKEGFITDKIRILGGKQAQALIDLDDVMLKGVERALKKL